MKTVGIIGGLGPETTARFYLAINFACLKLNKQNRPPMLLWNVPLEYVIEEDLLKRNVGHKRYLPYLIDAAKRLEAGGADFLVMPCNTLHIFIEEIRKAVSIPVLSIVEETVIFLNESNIRKVGIIATTATLEKKLYESTFGENKIQQLTPSAPKQAKIGSIINRLVLNRQRTEDRDVLIRIIEGFADQEAEHVVLACTDLQLLIPSHDSMQIHDTMQILADATVREILK